MFGRTLRLGGATLAFAVMTSPAHAVLLDWTIGGLVNATFQLDSNATPAATNVNGVRFDNIAAMVDGVSKTVSLHTFFNGSGGGFDLFNNDFSVNLHTNGPEIYTGPVAAPVFAPSSFNLTGSYSHDIFDPGISGAVSLNIASTGIQTTMYTATGPNTIQFIAPVDTRGVARFPMQVVTVVPSVPIQPPNKKAQAFFKVATWVVTSIFKRGLKVGIAPDFDPGASFITLDPENDFYKLESDSPFPFMTPTGPIFDGTPFTFHGTYTDSYDNVLTGDYSVVGVPGPTVSADFFDLSTDVPEPSSWAMLIAGFGLVGAVVRRRRLATA